ncbi:MAG: hypothetical protein IT429_03060, partial [Gemmataceae bacterium]|nr:hypothetical protein [Gemmataceae bacterium]
PFISPYASHRPEPHPEEYQRRALEQESAARQRTADDRGDDALASALQGLAFSDAVRKVEVTLIWDALDRCRHNQRRAAEALGLTYHQFRGIYRKYRDDFEGADHESDDATED